MSLAFMPLIRPDIVKLDLRLVQQRPGPAVAAIMNAVNAYAERSGATLLAEGIETEQHLGVARALGARLGQGWLFGRPYTSLTGAMPHGSLQLTARTTDSPVITPFDALPRGTTPRRSTKPLLVELSQHLERAAFALGSTAVVLSTFRYAHHFTPATSRRYQALAEQVGFVAALGVELSTHPAPGVRGAHLAHHDPLRDEWDVVVLAPHFSAALLARDLHPATGPQQSSTPDRAREFDFALTYDRDLVCRAAESLLARVLPMS